MSTGAKILFFFIVIFIIAGTYVGINYFSKKDSERIQKIETGEQLELLSWLGEIKDKEDLVEKLSFRKEEGKELIKQQLEGQGILINAQEVEELFSKYLNTVRNSTTTESILPVGSKLLSVGGKSREGNLVAISGSPEKEEGVILRTGKDEPAFYHYVNFYSYQIGFAILKNYGVIGLKEISPLLIMVEIDSQSIKKKILVSDNPTINAWLRGRAMASEPLVREKAYQCYQKTVQGWKLVKCP